MKKLDDVTKQIIHLVAEQYDRSIIIYKLMDYAEKAYDFNLHDLVKKLATECNVHESVIWEYRKAGKYSSAYQKKNGITEVDTHGSIDDILMEIASLIAKQLQSWFPIYLLMDECKQKKLWKQTSCKTFLQWIKLIAIQCDSSQSIFSDMMLAGGFVSKYLERHKNDKAADYVIRIPVKSLKILKKLTTGYNEFADDLIEKATRNQLVHDDLRKAYYKKKAEKNTRTKRVCDIEMNNITVKHMPADNKNLKCQGEIIMTAKEVFNVLKDDKTFGRQH